MKKGSVEFSTAFYLALAVLAAVAIIVVVAKYSDMPGKIKESVQGFMKYMPFKIAYGTGRECHGDDKTQNEESIRQIAESKGINPDLFAAIAEIENKFRHCDGKYVVESASDDIGIMQINRRTWDDVCKEYDVYDREENIFCAVKVLKQKYAITSTEQKYLNILDSQKNGCPQSRNYEMNRRFVGYAVNPHMRAVRGYNGFYCAPEGKKHVGSPGYVEDVWSKLSSEAKAELGPIPWA